MYRSLPINWVKAAFLVLYHGIAVSAFFQPFHWRYVPIALVVWLWFGFSATAYLHRYLAHRSFETTRFIRLLGFLGVACGQLGIPGMWAGHHRWHHAHSDQEQDLHSPTHGFGYAYLGWNLRIPMRQETRERSLGKDVCEREPLVGLAEKRPIVLVLLHAALAVTMATLLGYGGMAWCMYLPIVAVYHGAWTVNTLCHMPSFGTRPYETRDTSRNSLLLALFTLGDAWHNNHHAHPARANHGETWRQFDPTTWLLWTLEKLGLAWNVRWETPAARVAAEIAS